MKKINLAKIIFEKKLVNAWKNGEQKFANPEELHSFFERPAVKSLTLKELKRIRSLDDASMITSILKVYASTNFNDECEEYILGKKDKARISNIIFASKGKTQFFEACNVFCEMRPGNLMGKTDSIEKAVSYVANAEHKFQALYASYVATDPFFQRHENFISIVKVLSVLDKEDAKYFMGDILSARHNARDTREASAFIKESLLIYAKLMSIDIEDSGVGEEGSTTRSIIKRRRKIGRS